MNTRCYSPILSALTIWAAAASLACAAGRVELELVSEDRVPLTAQQEWARRLGRAGVTNLRIRPGRGGETARIETRGTKDRPVYVVTGVLRASEEIVVPGGRFKPGDAARLAQWLDQLARQGPPQQREEKSAFGLDRDVFKRVLEDLARPVGFSTAGLPRREVIEKIGRGLLMPLRVDPEALEAAAGDKLNDELLGVSSGTALAYALRPLGLGMVARQSGPGRAEYAVGKAQAEQTLWPVGWPPEQPRREVMPTLFEFLTVNIQGVSVGQSLEAIGKRLKTPMLFDRAALARQQIDPDKVQASLPRARLTYSILLRKVLFQARLKSELRVDESGKPLLWITTIKQP